MNKLSSIICILILSLSGCASLPTPTEKYQGQSAAKLFNEGELALSKREYTNAIEHFDALNSLYPYSVQSEQALLDSIYAYYKTDDFMMAVATAERFIRLYPRSEKVDYAYYMKGLASFEQDRGWLQRYVAIDLAERDPNNARQAFANFNQLLTLFPHSPYAADARQRMVYLRNLLAENELRIADMYLKQHRYIAAANRASYVLEHYQRTPATKQALQILVLTYQKLGLDDKAKAAIQI